MSSKNAVRSEQKRKDSNDVRPFSVELVPDHSVSGPPGVDHDIKTLRSGRVVSVQEWTPTPRKVKKVDVILGTDNSSPSPGIRKCTSVGFQQATSSPNHKNIESEQAILSPGIKKRKAVESQQDTPSSGIKKHKSVEVQQATPSPGIKKHQNTGSQLKTKSLSALSDQTVQNKSKASESGVQEGNSCGEWDADLIHLKASNDDSSSKNMQRTSSDGADDTDTTGGFLKDFLQCVKSKNKFSPAKLHKVDNKLTSNSLSCDECYLDGKSKLCSSNSSGKRKKMSEKENAKTKAGEVLVLEDEETLACFKDKAIKKFRSQRTSLHQIQYHVGFQLNDHKQGVSDVTNPENSRQNVICSESAGHSYTAQLNNGELQEMTDLTNSENFTKNVPTSESSGRLYPDSKLDLAKGCVLGVNCQRNAVGVMELVKPESKMQRSESVSDKPTLQKGPYLVESVLEQAADSPNHTASVVDMIHVSSVHVGLLSTESVMEQDDCGDAFQELPAKLPSVRKSMTPYSQERLLQAADFRQDFTKSPSEGSASQQSESDAANKMDVNSDSNSNGFTFQSSDANGLESPCHNRMPLQVDDFRRAFTKSPPAGCASQQCESDAADKMDVDSDLCDSNPKGFTFQSPEVQRSTCHNKRLLQVEDFRRSFMKSPPTAGIASQQCDSDAADSTNMVSCDSKSNACTFLSSDFKCLGSPSVNKRPIRQRNSPMPHRKSPQSRILHHIPLAADRLGIQLSPLPQRNMSENNYAGNHREEASPSSAIKSILKSPSICPTACKCDICYSMQSRAEKASEFTQRQMRDIENLANNLVRELNSMRTIVEENLNSEAVRPTVEEMKCAAASALDVEETAKKWIAMMSRDCSRFCQIMRPVEKKPSFSSDREKQPKKITFADEAGKELCHFKIFENDEQEDLNYVLNPWKESNNM